MEEINMLTLVLIIGGSIAGYFAAMFFVYNDKTRKNLTEQLVQKQKELDDYQSRVAQHFNQTADLFSELQAQQDKIVSHLADGARGLRCDTLVQKVIISTQGVQDYAPKDYPMEKYY
jgi:uncharacterized membrane-anchored protein YhcB (DUF1043 family)